ncbi:dockerin type I domain-containing protein [Neorhodopirellula lusitana]|uniref:dockerin type I domain-containing protein n=1 Tax=Neorhodopirellula lusitana TaxID=445327 RepID=UPI00384CBF29
MRHVSSLPTAIAEATAIAGATATGAFKRSRSGSRSSLGSGKRARALRFQQLDSRQMLAGDIAGVSANTSLVDDSLIAEGEAPNSVYFTFDYSNDNGYFSGAYAYRRDALEQAGEILTDRLRDTLAAIPASNSTHTWQASYQNPSTGRTQSLPSGFSVDANEILVYAGGRNLSGLGSDTRAIAVGVQAPFSYACSTANTACTNFVSNLTTRGEGQTIGSGARDFAPFVASISFDTRNETTSRWSYENEALEDDDFRFLSFAVHELSHVLGIGISDSYIDQVSNFTFTGSKTRQAYQGSGNLPLDGPSAARHVAQSVLQTQNTLMTPSVENLLPSELDFALLDDIGWEVVSNTKPTVTLDRSSIVVLEDEGTVLVNATLSAATPNTVTVPIVISGVAAEGSDVSLSATSITFAPNATTATIEIDIVDDATFENTEAMTITVVDSATANVGNQTAFRLTIFDNDGVDWTQVPVLDLDDIGNTFSVAGDNQPRAFMFRADSTRTLSVQANNVDQINRAVLLVDHNGNTLGEYSSTGIASATIESGKSYALIFFPRTTARTFSLTAPGGFTAVTSETRTNVLDPADVDGDNSVIPLDALLIINQINLFPNVTNAYSTAIVSDDYFDVSGDGILAPLDALLVINEIFGDDSGSDEPAAFTPLVSSQLASNQLASSELRSNALDSGSLDSKTLEPDSLVSDALQSAPLESDALATPQFTDATWIPDSTAVDDKERRDELFDQAIQTFEMAGKVANFI